MGHLINPIRYRLGNSIFWANNWPATEKTQYFLSYEIHQELDQYFRNLFYFFRKFKFKKQRKGGQIVLRKIRHPKLYYSHVNVNFFGLNSDKIMIDVNAYDFFLDNYLNEALSTESIKKPDAINIANFIKKFNRYIGFEFFFKYKRIVQKMTKEQFSAVLKSCRSKVKIVEQIAVNKLQIFIEIYTEFIRRSLFGVFNDQFKIFNPTEQIFIREKKALNRLSFSRRVKLINKYWSRKYSHAYPENKSLLTFKNFFTSEFYSLVTPRKILNNKEQQERRTELAVRSYRIYTQQYRKEIENRSLALTSFSERIKKKLEVYLQKTNAVTLKPAPFFKSNINSEFRTFPKEIPSSTHKNLYSKEKTSLSFSKKSPIIPLFFSNFCNDITINFLLKIKDQLPNINDKITDIISLISKGEIVNLTTSQNISKLYSVIYFIEKNIPSSFEVDNFLIKALQYINDVVVYNRLQYKYIKNSIKKTANYWLKYDLDPFYQKYMALKNFKDLYLNINFGIGPEEDTDHDIIDAKFIALYIRRLFKRNKFKVADLQRTVYRSLSKLPYIEGFVIIFAGRFTRRESKIRRISKGGVFHYGAISKLVDYHTIGFTNKFGYCGVKIFIQYKAKWPTIEQQYKKEIEDNNYALPSPINLIKESNSKLDVVSDFIRLKPSSKRYIRLFQNLFSRNQIPYYGKN